MTRKQQEAPEGRGPRQSGLPFGLVAAVLVICVAVVVSAFMNARSGNLPTSPLSQQPLPPPPLPPLPPPLDAQQDEQASSTRPVLPPPLPPLQPVQHQRKTQQRVVWWHAPFFSGGGMGVEAQQLVLGLQRHTGFRNRRAS